jgi:GntR family transcriptional regulator
MLITNSTASGPHYKLLREQILNDLKNGVLKPGEAIPPEVQIRDKYGVSIGTIRKAVDKLVEDGLLIRQQGRGTFVSVHDQQRTLHSFFRIANKNGQKEVPHGEVVSFSKGRADEALARSLNVKVGVPIFAMRNLLSLGGSPVIVDDIQLPQHLFPNLTKSIIQDRQDEPIYHLYHSKFGINVLSIIEYLTAVRAPADVRTLLQVPAQTPLLQVDRIALTFDDVPVEFRRRYVHTEQYEYVNDPR